jgi:hypothetical protein
MQTLISVLLLLLAAPAQAQDGGHVREDHVEVRRDMGDLERLRDDIRAWKAAVVASDKAAEKAADTRIEAWIRTEAAETTHEVREDRAELGQARAEAKGPGKGDEMDRRDDRADLAREHSDRQRMRAIAGDLKTIQPEFAQGRATAAQYAKKKALLEELETLAENEITRGRGEVREDVRENHEVRPH